MGTVACCWCHNSGGGGGGNSAIADYDGVSHTGWSRRSGLEELLRNQLTRYRQGVGEVRCGRCEIRQQDPAQRLHGTCMATTTRT